MHWTGTTDDAELTRLLLDSYRRVVGVPMLRPDGLDSPDLSRWLYRDAPFGLLVHDTAVDPVFRYANLTAQRWFGYNWQEIVGLPSRLSAAEVDQQDRQRFMAAALERGYVAGYRGQRVAKSGRRFWIEDATVWNLRDAGGDLHGQAALIRRWADAEAPPARRTFPIKQS